MKKRFTILFGAFCALMILISMPGKAVGQASVGTTLWSEDFSGYENNTVPSGEITNSHDGTTVYGGVTLTYACVNGSSTTQTYTSGGPNSNSNLLISKNGGSFTISGISTGEASELTVSYEKSGSGTVTISSSTTGVTISGSTITTGGASTISITFTNSTGSNLRFDDAVITVKTAGGQQLTPSNLAITDAPVALSFDLTNNSTAQTVSYTTSSAGAITITPANPTSYFSYVHNATEKTITVTPLAVTPSAQTVTISQEADATYAAGSKTFTVTIVRTHTATFSVNGATTSTTFAEGATITFPANPSDIYGKTFVGWTAAAINGTTNTAPTFVTSATMGDSDVTYYAVFAKVTGTTPASWTETEIGDITSSDVFVISNGSYAMNNDNGTSSAPITNSISVTNGSLDTAPANNLKWNVSGNATDGYTFYPNGLTTTWLYCSTTASSGSNDNIRVGTGNRKVWKINNSGYLITNDTYTVRYLSISVSSDFRGYVNTSNGAFIPKFYKYIASSTTYANYCTTVVETYTLTYDGNGATSGNVPADATDYSSGAIVTVLGNTGDLAKTGYTFVNWNTDSEGHGTDYGPATEHTSITITENITLYAQWTANEHNITKSAMANGSVTVKVGGNEVSKAHTDETVTLEVSPNPDYVLESLTVTQGVTPVELLPDFSPSIHTYTITMPAGDVNVSASFKIAWTVQFSVNGTVNNLWTRVKDNNAEIGELPTPANSDIPEGFTFKGWTASTQYYHASDAPTMITASTPITNSITYAAVFAEAYEGSSLTTATLTESEITTNITNTTCAYGTEKSYNDMGDGIKWTASCYTDAASRKWMQLKNDNTAYIKIEASDNIKRLDVTITSAQNASQGINDITKHDAFSNSGTISLRTASNGGDVVGSTSGSSIDNNVATINTTVNKTTVYLKVSTGARVWGITVKCAPTEYKNYTTLVTDQSISGNTTGVTRIFGEIAATAGFKNNGTITIYDGGVLNMGNYKLTNTDATKLIIEDGGQLILKDGDDDVAATVKKNIAAGVPETKTAAQNWYIISSSVNAPYIKTGTNLITGTTTPNRYDLYRYDVTSAKWENYKSNPAHDGFNVNQPESALENGRGYLYRNESAMTIEFTGNVNTSASYTVTAGGPAGFEGFNLLGNPYTHEIYKGGAFPNTGTGDPHYVLATGFYKLNSAGGWEAGTDSETAIAPNEGILIQATTGGTITIDNTTNKTRYNNEYLQFTVANSEYEDVAYAWFDKGAGLNKINHRNAEIPMLYINQEGQDYAIATMSDDTKTFNLNFKAMTTGKYTLSYKANGEFKYIHVIDRLTGEDVDMLLEGEYSFIGSTNDSDARFIVKLGYMPNYSDAENDIFAYQNGSEILVSGEGELQIFDVMGRKVSTMNIYGIETVNGLAQGVYIFRLEGKTQKIVVR
jgi:Listeria/Bacterioides repeat